jgi:predicted nuclease with TOPRIM domain
MAEYPDSIKEAFKSLKAAKAVIKRLYEENQTIKESLKLTQDELENWKDKYHESDKQKSILDAKLQTTVLSEIFKFLASTVAAGIGINLLTNGKIASGLALLVVGVILFVGITYLGKSQK